MKELGNSVQDLQKMLRDLSKVYEFMPLVPLDGIFGDETLEAVMIYQREFCPPITGIVNQEVWESIRNEQVKQEEKLAKPRVLRAFPEGKDGLDFGDEESEIALFQTMFSLLGRDLVEIQEESPTGLFTETLRKNVIWLQSISGLPTTGTLNRATWDRLARLYEIYVTSG